MLSTDYFSVIKKVVYSLSMPKIALFLYKKIAKSLCAGGFAPQPTYACSGWGHTPMIPVSETLGLC